MADLHKGDEAACIVLLGLDELVDALLAFGLLLGKRLEQARLLDSVPPQWRLCCVIREREHNILLGADGGQCC